jgi:hypothetical protein
MTDESWERLLAHLAGLGGLSEIAPGRFRLDLGDRAVTVLVTPDDWDDISVIWGSNDAGALRDVTRAVDGLGPDDAFLVWENYELHPSPTEQTPLQRENEEMTRLIAEARQRNPDATFGWYAERPDGTRDWFKDAPDD